jgi:hypothetical protein
LSRNTTIKTPVLSSIRHASFAQGVPTTIKNIVTVQAGKQKAENKPHLPVRLASLAQGVPATMDPTHQPSAEDVNECPMLKRLKHQHSRAGVNDSFWNRYVPGLNLIMKVRFGTGMNHLPFVGTARINRVTRRNSKKSCFPEFRMNLKKGASGFTVGVSIF